ncbi:MAG: RICIN domain-containing protein, partial [Paludibacteraceae bacterium]|nr:RICIN domain-containing protein [Paludibacteraceae bacterium]
MKKNLLLLLGVLLVCMNSWAAYELVWCDEFNANELNRTAWTVQTGGGGWGNNELQYYTDRTSNIYVGGGNLHIIARKEDYGGRNYTSGRMEGNGHMQARYGRVEARIKCPPACMGSWPAFWMLGKRPNGACDWPSSGEIDIMEQMCNGDPATWNTTLCTLHWNTSGKESYYDWGNQWNHGMYSLSRNVGEQLGNRYRIYGVEWTPTKIIGYYSDGDAGNCGPGNRVEYYVADIGNAANGLDAFSEYEFFILLNYAVGGTYVGGNVEPNFGTREMLVDWVRIYQDRAAYPGSTLNNQTNLTPANQGMNGNNGGGNNTINYAIDGENITTLTAGKSTTFNVKYSAPSESDIWLTLYHVTGDNWDLIAEKKKVNSVAAGENKTTTITLDIPSSVEGRNDYTLFFDIRPVGTDWQQRKANEQINNVTVKSIPKGVSGKSGKYKIKRTDCDQYWDMNGNGTANGTALCQYNDEGTELSQQFHLEEVSANSGIYRIYANDTGKLIDINAASQDNGAKVQIWENTNCECQQFILVDAGNGAYNFIALHSLKAIEVPSCSMNANTNMQQWDNNGQSCAKWQLIPYSQVTANQNNNNTSSSNEKYCGKRVVGYFPTYRYSTVNSVDFSAMTHCLLSFALYANGNVYFQDFSADQIRNVVNKCHAGNTKILLAIGGWDGFKNDGAFSTAAKRTSFVNQVMNYVNTYGFDGVDLDIELNDADIWNNIDALLSELKSALNGKLVTMALSTWFSNGIPNSAYQKLDFINLMSYDYNQNGTGDHAPWQQIYDMVGYYRARGVSDDKMTIGVPFYGYSTSGAKTFGEIVGWDAANANKDFANGTYYNGIPTIKAKAKYSKDFGGVMFWEAGQDAFNSYSLLKAIKEEMSDCSGNGGTEPSVTETVAFDSKPTSLDSKTSYSFKINYTAAQQREVWVTMYDNSGNWQVLTNGEAYKTVNAGSGSTTVTVNLATAPNAGNGYVIKADIRPVGGSWDTYIKEELAQNITIKSTESAGTELSYNSSCNLLRNASIDFSHSFFATGDNWVENPSVKPTGNSFQKITYNMPEATSAQWQAQVVATSNVILKAGTKYEMSVKLKSTVNMSNVTLKCYQFGVNDVYFPSDNSGQGISLTANTTKTIALKDLTVSNDLNPLSVLFDFGDNPAGSVEISDIVIKEVACTPTYLKTDHPVATFYADINYAGTAIGLEEGSYKSSDLEDYGIKLKDITSIKALPGFKVTIYTADNFGGNSKAFTGDVNYVGADWNDKMMSVKIEASGVSGVSGVRIINNRKSSKNLDVAGFSTVSGTQLIQYNVTNTDNQRFEFKEISNGVYRLQVKNAGGKYLGIRSGSYDNGAALETQDLNNNAKSQQFILVEAGDGLYKLVARHSGKIVEISNGIMDNDALAQQWTDNGQVCGQWTINYYCGTTVSIAPASKVLTCTESLVVLTASANETATYKWSNNSTANTNKVTNSGAYVVTVTNGVGCTATASVSVSANKTAPTITIGGAQDITCKTVSMVLTASGADSYTWTSGEKVATKEVTAAGTYSVVGRNANGCEATKAVTIVENKETVAVTIGGNEVLTCANPSITLQANAALADSYRWNDNSTGATKVVTNAGQRNVTVTYGTCTASASVSVS